MADDPDQDIVPVKETNGNSNPMPKETISKQFLMKLDRGELEDKNYRLMEENTQLKRQCIDMNEKNKRLSARLIRLMDKEKPRGPVEARRNFQLELVVDEQKAKISELEATNFRLEERIIVMKTQMAEHERLHSRSQRNRSLIKSPRRTSSAVTVPIREDIKTIDKLKIENSTLKEEILALKKELEYVKAQNANRLSELERKLAESISEEQKKQHSESLEMMRLKRALKKQAAELGVLQTENQLREKDLIQARKTIEEMHAESEKLEKELSDKSNLITELKYSLDTLKRDMRNIEELQQEIEDHKKEVNNLKEYRARMLSLTTSPEDHETEDDVQVTNELTSKVKELENKLMSESVEKALLLSTVDELKQRISKLNDISTFSRKQFTVSVNTPQNGQAKAESSLGSETSVSHIFLQNVSSLQAQQTEETGEKRLEKKFSEKINQLEKKLEEEQVLRENIMKILSEERKEKEKRLGNNDNNLETQVQAKSSAVAEIPNTHIFLQNLASHSIENFGRASEYHLEQRLSDRINRLEQKLEKDQSHRNTILNALSEKHEDKENRLGSNCDNLEIQVTRYAQVAAGSVSCATQTESDNVRNFDEDALGKAFFSTKKYYRSNSTGAYSQIPSLKQSKAVMCPHFMVNKHSLQEEGHNLNAEDSCHFKDSDPVDESTSASLDIGLPHAILSAIHNISVDSNEDDTQISAASNVSLSAGEIIPAPHTTSGAKLLQTTINKKANNKKPEGAAGVDLAAAYVEKLQELTKYQELLRVQYNLNSAYKKEVSSLSQRLYNRQDNEDRNSLNIVTGKSIEPQSKYKFGTNTVRETTLRRQQSIPLGYDQGIFEFHVHRLMKLEERTVALKDTSSPSLIISWVFFNQDVNCTPVKTGTDITFDYSVVYRVEVNHLFFDYLKNRECTLELQVITDDIPQCVGRGSLRFTEILEYPDNKLHSSVQIVSIQEENPGVILGVVECWFRMKCSSAMLGKLRVDSAHQASQKVVDTITYSSRTEDEANTLTSEPSSSSSPHKQSRPVPIPRRRRLSKNGKDKGSS